MIVESYELQAKQLFIDLQQIAYIVASLDKIHNFIIDCSSEHDENSINNTFIIVDMKLIMK